MTNKIQVVDSLPGTGKTTAIFNIMRNKQQEKWLYVSPLRSEVEQRIIDEVPELNFKAPEDKNISKTADILKLIEDGGNIGCTHALFELMSLEHWEALQEQRYNVVIDEEVGAIKNFPCNSRDVKIMVDMGLAEIVEPYGKVKLTQPVDYYIGSSYEAIAKEAAKGTLYRSNVKDGQSGYLVTQLPIELFLTAKTVTILTYMFEGSLLDNYLKLYGINWECKVVELRKSNKEVIASLRDNINFRTLPALDALSKFRLNHSWYEDAKPEQLQLVGNAYRAVLRKHKNDDSKVIVTLPKANAEKPKKGAAKANRYVGRAKDKPVFNCYLSPRSRATNLYADRNVVIHLYNRNPNMSVVEYFRSYALSIDRDKFALSEMIQFIFRSAVRNGEPIDLYVASPRMKKLLQDWLSEQEEELFELVD